MKPTEKQSSGSIMQVIRSHLSRDNLILIAALAFLTLAVLLAVVFPPVNSRAPGQIPSAVAQVGTAVPTPGVARATIAAEPSIAPTVVAVPSMEPTTLPTVAPGGYPGPATATPPDGFTGNPFVSTPVDGSDPELLLPTGVVSGPTMPSGVGFVPEPTASTGNLPTFAPIRSTSLATSSPTGSDTGFVILPTSQIPSGLSTAAPPDEGGSSDVPTAAVAATATLPSAGGAGEPPIATNAPALPTATRTPIPPTAVPTDLLRGTIHWTAARGPLRVTRDLRLVAGATLLIEPGVEVRFDPGVAFFVEGTLYALGQPNRPVRLVGSQSQRWEGIFGQPGSDIALEYTDIRGGGAGGTVLSSEAGNLVFHHTRVNDNGGHIQVVSSRLEVRDSEIAGNDMPYGSALDVTYENGGFLILTNNRIGGNRMSFGAAAVQIASQSPSDIVNLDIQGNLLMSQDGPDLGLSANGTFQGGITCNTLTTGLVGLNIRSQNKQLPALSVQVSNNAIEAHTPPILPIYLEYGIGRGATSELALDMRGNWWGNALGPYHPDLHADGRGEAVGVNIAFDPWLNVRPACVPNP